MQPSEILMIGWVILVIDTGVLVGWAIYEFFDHRAWVEYKRKRAQPLIDQMDRMVAEVDELHERLKKARDK